MGIAGRVYAVLVRVAWALGFGVWLIFAYGALDPLRSPDDDIPWDQATAVLVISLIAGLALIRQARA